MSVIFVTQLITAILVVGYLTSFPAALNPSIPSAIFPPFLFHNLSIKLKTLFLGLLVHGYVIEVVNLISSLLFYQLITLC
jgi:hypothetical protein